MIAVSTRFGRAIAIRPGVALGAAVHLASAIAVVAVLAAGVASARSGRHVLFAALAWLAASLVPFAIVYKHYYPWLVPALFPMLRLALERRVDAGTGLLVCSAAGLLHFLTAPGLTLSVVALAVACHVAAQQVGAAARDTEPA